MRIGRLSTSSSRFTFGLMALCIIGVAGCSTNGALLLDSGSQGVAKSDFQQGIENIKVATNDGLEQAKGAADQSWQNVKQAASDVKDYLSLKPTIQPVDSSDISVAKIQPAADTSDSQTYGKERESFWCESLRQKALVESTILKSPVLGASVDGRGRGELTLGLSYSAFKKAQLGEDRAEIECRKFTAETALQKLIFTSPQNLTAAGFRSKADVIDGMRVEMARLRQNIKASLNNGNITHDKATALLMLLDQLVAEGKSARSQADRRFDEHIYSNKSAQHLEDELRKAQYDLDIINSQTITADNMDVSVQAGYNHYLKDAPAWSASETQGITGKVSFSMKLGVLDPRRYEHERLASEARQNAITHEETSPVWQVSLLRRSHQRAISGLEQSRLEIEKATTEAKHLLALMSDVPQPEFDGPKLNARYQLMKLRADRAAVAGSILEIKKNLRRLNDG